MRPTTIVTVAAVFALLVVAKSRTVGITEAIGSTAQSAIALDAGHASLKNLPPLPDFPPP